MKKTSATRSATPKSPIRSTHNTLPESTRMQSIDALNHHLAAALAAFGQSARDAIDKTDKGGDKATADLFTEIVRGIDQNLWFVESHSPLR